jgi:hypothetical protein
VIGEGLRLTSVDGVSLKLLKESRTLSKRGMTPEIKLKMVLGGFSFVGGGEEGVMLRRTGGDGRGLEEPCMLS